MAIGPIETRYHGYRFRSRLEARWAVFYDYLEISYQYEPEGFDLDGVWYLPDFYLPEYDYWIEIKPKIPQVGSTDWIKITSFATCMQKTIYIAVGECWHPYDRRRLKDLINKDIKNYHIPVRPGPNIASHHWWVECPICQQLSLVVFGHTIYTRCGCSSDGEIQFSDSPRLIEAYRHSRSARFEHEDRNGV